MTWNVCKILYIDYWNLAILFPSIKKSNTKTSQPSRLIWKQLQQYYVFVIVDNFIAPFFLAQQPLPPPPVGQGLLIQEVSRSHTNDAPQSVGILWTSDQLVAETSTWQHKTLTTDIHAPGGIRTHNLSRRAAAGLRLRPRDHWDRLIAPVTCKKLARAESREKEVWSARI